MRISDWSSDVCSSDLIALVLQPVVRVGQRLAVQRHFVRALFRDRGGGGQGRGRAGQGWVFLFGEQRGGERRGRYDKRGGNCRQKHPNSAHQKTIGRASCRERVCQYV